MVLSCSVLGTLLPLTEYQIAAHPQLITGAVLILSLYQSIFFGYSFSSFQPFDCMSFPVPLGSDFVGGLELVRQLTLGRVVELYVTGDREVASDEDGGDVVWMIAEGRRKKKGKKAEAT